MTLGKVRYVVFLLPSSIKGQKEQAKLAIHCAPQSQLWKSSVWCSFGHSQPRREQFITVGVFENLPKRKGKQRVFNVRLLCQPRVTAIDSARITAIRAKFSFGQPATLFWQQIRLRPQCGAALPTYTLHTRVLPDANRRPINHVDPQFCHASLIAACRLWGEQQRHVVLPA